jgi:enoyl-CoA hydratase
MAWETLLVERHPDGFATVVLNRPQKLNTLSIALRREFEHVIGELEADPAVRVLILTGNGRAFSAGLDLDEWAAPGVVAAAAYEHDMVASLLRFTGPVIGAINGVAITGGLETALACDMLIASSEARFADTHVKVGLLPGWGGSARMVRLIGLQRSKEMALTGRFVGADEAFGWGLVNRVVPPERLRAEAEAIAREMLAGVPDGLVAYKRLLDQEAGATFEESLRIERAASLERNVTVPLGDIDTRLARLRRQR